MAEETVVPIRENFVKVGADEFLFNVVPRLIDDGIEEAQVFDGKDYIGVLSLRELGRKGRIQSETRVNKVVKRIKPVSPTDSVKDVASKLLSQKVHSIVVEDEKTGKALGVVHALDLVEKFFPSPNDTAISYATEDVQRVSELYTLSVAIKLLRAFNVSRLPVVNEANEVIGTISSTNIFGLVFRQPSGERITDPEGLVFDPYSELISDFMTDPLPIIPSSSTVKDAIDSMVDRNIDAVLIGDPFHLQGILTLTDLLEPLTVPEAQSGYYVQVVGEELDEVDLDRIISEVTSFLQKFSEAIGENGQVVVHIKTFEKNKFRTHVLYQIRLRVYTDKGFLFVSNGQGFGLIPAINDAIERLTREVVTKKEPWKKHDQRALIREFLFEL